MFRCWMVWREKERSNIMVKVMCYYLDGTINLYIEGITITVVLDQMKIVRYLDRLMLPVPKANGTDYMEPKQRPHSNLQLDGIKIVQPNEPNFTLDGNTVR